MRDDPGLRVETEVDWVLILHFLKALSKVGLACDPGHRWEVVDFLEGLELAEFLGQDGHVVPDQVDVRMPSDLVFFGLFGLLLLYLLASHVLLARVTTVMMIFATSTCLGWLFVFLICALLGCDDFPFHGEGALT